MDVLKQAKAHQSGKHARTAIRDKWQRNPRHGHQPHRHTDIFKGLEGKPADDSHAYQSTEEVISALGYQECSPEKEAEEANDETRTDKASLFTCHCKNKVGLLFWNEAAICLRTVE